jgi:iron complex outermembrane receptor protein
MSNENIKAFGAVSGIAALGVAAVILGAAVPASAAAADASSAATDASPAATDQSDSGGLEEIIVSARRRQEDLQTVPISIAVVTGKELEERGIDDQIELNRMVPDLVIHGSNGFFGLQEGGFGMRGIQDVTIYYDGIAHPETFGVPAGDILEVDHIEVLRGPQGTLFGKDTMGGAIQYVTKLPGDTFGIRAKVTTGSFDRYDGTIYMDLPITSTLLTKLTLAKLTKGGYVQSVSNNTAYGSQNNTLADYDILWKPFDGFTWRFDASYTNELTDGEPGTDWAIDTGPNCVNPAPTAKNAPNLTCLYNAIGLTIPSYWAYGASQQYKTSVNYIGPDPYTTIRGLASQIRYDFSEHWTAKALGSMRRVQSFDWENFSGTKYNMFSGKNYNEQDENTYETQLLFHNDRWTGTNGAFYYMDDRRFARQNWLQNELQPGVNPTLNAAAINYLIANGYGYSTVPGVGPALGGDGNIDQLTYTNSHGWALFGEWTYKITDKLSATAGARYNEDYVNVTSYVPLNPLPLQCCEPAASVAPLEQVPGSIPQILQFHNLAPKGSVSYQWLPDIMTYVAYSQGFDRGGGSTTNPPGGGSPIIIPYQPETLDNYEVGIRSDLFDRHVRENFTVFYDQYKGIQVSQDVNKINVTRNGGQAVTKGIENEGQWAVTSDALLYYNFAYDSAKITHLAPGTTANITVGQVLAYAPEYSVSTGGSYDFHLPTDRRITVRADYGWNSYEYTTNDFTNRAYIPGFGLLSGRLTYHPPGDQWDVELGGTNLTDKYYRYNGYRVPGILVDTGAPGRPREWSLTVHAKFE